MMNGLMGLIAMAPPAGGEGQASPLGMLPMMAIMAAIVYFMMIRPQQRKERERRAMVEAVKTGDRVVFAGGLLGTVANTKELTLLIKVADNVKLEVARSAVSRVLDKDDKGIGEEPK